MHTHAHTHTHTLHLWLSRTLFSPLSLQIQKTLFTSFFTKKYWVLNLKHFLLFWAKKIFLTAIRILIAITTSRSEEKGKKMAAKKLSDHQFVLWFYIWWNEKKCENISKDLVTFFFTFLRKIFDEKKYFLRKRRAQKNSHKIYFWNKILHIWRMIGGRGGGGKFGGIFQLNGPEYFLHVLQFLWK